MRERRVCSTASGELIEVPDSRIVSPARGRATATVVVIDDEPMNIELLRAILRRDPSIMVHSTTNAEEALGLINRIDPDLVLLDLMMPRVSGFEILERLRAEQSAGAYRPVLVLTADASQQAIHRALEAGATDFVTKPVDPTEVFLRISNLLHTRALYGQVAHHNQQLEQRVVERTRRLAGARDEILERLARATEFRDDTTGQHAQRVGITAGLLWEALGLPKQGRATIEKAAPLHDVGKVGIPDSILLKPGRLTTEEFEVVKQHTVIGAGILSGSEFPVLQMAERIARSHHECWDGSGYPDGIAGEEIPIEARIVKACDIFDAMINERPYKAACDVEEAREEIERCSGSLMDSKVAEALCRLIDDGLTG